MCGRYVSPDQAAIERAWSIGGRNNTPFRERYNVTPQQGNPAAYVPVIRNDTDGNPELSMLQWWLLPHWSKEPRIKFTTFNARTDTAASAASFRTPFRKRRCIVPALGWFEWQITPRGKMKWFLHRPGQEMVRFAGLWDRWHRGDEVIESCTIVVGKANNAMSYVHDRMPVIIKPEDEAFWLDRKIDDMPALESLLTSPPEDFITADLVRNEKRPRDDDPTLIDPLPEELRDS